MDTKPLLYGLIGFMLGGLLVSSVASWEQSSKSNDEKSMSQMTNELKTLRGDDFDHAFIVSMIDHHRSAVDMARLADERAKHTEIKQLSQAIITAQESEIGQMNAWLGQWNYGNDPLMHNVSH